MNFDPGHKNPQNDEIKHEPDTAHTESSGTSNTLTTDRPEEALTQVPTTQADQKAPRRRKFGGLLGGLKHKEDKGKENEKEDGDGSKDELYRTDSNGKKKMIEPKFTWQSQVRNTLFNSPINILLVAVPVGIAIGALKNADGTYKVDAKAVFAINFIAIVPLAAMLSYATEEVALRTGETIGGLLNASFGNATELIVSIIALFNDEILITQTSLIGSMLSNLLLVLGMCFFFGGLTRIKQKFNIVVAQTASSLLTLALAGVIIPTVFDVSTTNSTRLGTDITMISRGVSILLLIVYLSYLFFQLHTHKEIYNATSEKVPKRGHGKGDATKNIAQMGGMAGMIAPAAQEEAQPDEEEEQETPKLNFWVALVTLLVATALIAANSEFMVDAIPFIAADGTISRNFLGLILIPIVGNAAEHATAVTVACKDKMDLAIGVAVGSSLQIAALVLPLVVIIGWIAGKDQMTLDFDIFQVVVLFVSVLLVQSLIGDGESHWLEGTSRDLSLFPKILLTFASRCYAVLTVRGYCYCGLVLSVRVWRCQWQSVSQPDGPDYKPNVRRFNPG